MRRVSLASSLAGLVLFFGACSLINAPDEVKPPDTSGGGGMGTSSSSSSSTSSSSSSGGGCMNDMDCPAPAEQCKIARCDATHTCVEDQAPNNTPCDDGRFCTDMDFCSGGVCMGGDPHPCPPSTPCVIATCDDALTQCSEVPKPDGSFCDDNDPCTATSTCANGACVSGPSCQSDECNDNVCDPNMGCVKTPKAMGTSCGNTACSTGQCDTEGKCLITAINQGGPCDDGLFCTTGDTCNNFGQCIGGASPCSAPAPCIKATCNEATDACDFTAIPMGELCDDGDSCTADEKCNNVAQCTGGVQSTVFFFDNFAGLNAQGWTLDNEWQIGQATASTLGTNCCGFTPDPNVDFNGDGKVAGVVLGGNASINLHPYAYMTSPVIDASSAPGALYLTFRRWLNSDYPPFMHNVVEVSTDGGANWNTVWIGADGIPIADGGWVFIAHDISLYKSANLRFRFGFDVASSGVFTVGSWNIDYVKVQTAACNQ